MQCDHILNQRETFSHTMVPFLYEDHEMITVYLLQSAAYLILALVHE